LLSEPPPGWITLQARARETKDPNELAAIIEEMNRLLAELEEAAGDGHTANRRPASREKPAKKKDLQNA
jgi:hypothetical protein